MNLRLLPALLALLPSLALAQTWSVSRESGVVVMGDASRLTFRVTNTSTTADRINRIVLGVDPHNQYDVSHPCARSSGLGTHRALCYTGYSLSAVLGGHGTTYPSGPVKDEGYVVFVVYTIQSPAQHRTTGTRR